MHSLESSRFLPSEVAAAAWRESLTLWGVQWGRSCELVSALAARRSLRAPSLASAMAAAKVPCVFFYSTAPPTAACDVWRPRRLLLWRIFKARGRQRCSGTAVLSTPPLLMPLSHSHFLFIPARHRAAAVPSPASPRPFFGRTENLAYIYICSLLPLLSWR
jgi:hypothetical protein